MKINIVSKTPVIETPHQVDVRKMYDHESAQAMHITLQPGEALKPHITPVDVFFYILEGTPEVMVGLEKIQAERDSLIESPNGVVHCLYNNSEAVARILVVKAPKPLSNARIL
ncbi:MAG: cupin domain-containing protein [Bacteroidales bacterium]|nr:cupin domain-containing protein [Bacteroidales bacterium]